MHSCYWPQPSATPNVLSVSDRATEEEEHGEQAGQLLSSPAATDATMADEEASEAVSVHSSSSESPTMPSAVQPEEDDARIETVTVLPPPLQKTVIAFAIIWSPPKHDQHKTKCWQQKMR